MESCLVKCLTCRRFLFLHSTDFIRSDKSVPLRNVLSLRSAQFDRCHCMSKLCSHNFSFLSPLFPTFHFHTVSNDNHNAKTIFVLMVSG